MRLRLAVMIAFTYSGMARLAFIILRPSESCLSAQQMMAARILDRWTCRMPQMALSIASPRLLLERMPVMYAWAGWIRGLESGMSFSAAVQTVECILAQPFG